MIDRIKVYELPDGRWLQVNLTDEGIIADAFEGEHHVGTFASMADELWEAMTE